MPAARSLRPSRFRPLWMLATIALIGCGSDVDIEGLSAWSGARLIVGDGDVFENGVLLVRDATIEAVGPAGSVEIPSGVPVVDATGQTIMPALVNAHFHLASEREARTEQLLHLAYYGTSAAISLGLDEGDTGLVMRDEVIPDGARSQSAGRGITSPEPGRSEVPFWITSPTEAREAIRELAAAEVDFVKIWVDSRDLRYTPLSEELYSEVISAAHAEGLRVTAHVFNLEDGKGLLGAGIDAFAHGIRDQDVDDEIVEMWQARPEVVLVPNLPATGLPTDLSWMSGTVPAATLAEMQTRQAEGPGLSAFFGIQARNLVRLHEAGVTIAFGTDGGSPWAVHQELEDMVQAGMDPADVIVAATKNSAELLRLDDLGELRAGASADFIVLDANPLEDIRNTRSIDSVVLRGSSVDRDAISRRLLGSDD